jgi:anti-sigma factor RsiW
MKRALYRLRFGLEHRWTPPHASEYIDGELSSRASRRVEHHAGDCPECRELLQGLRTLVGTLGTLRGDGGGLLAGSILASVRGRLDEAPRDSA